MSRRFQARRGNGRFTRNTLENTVGLHCLWCPHCGRGNPSPVGQPQPTECHACGKPLEGDEPGSPFDTNEEKAGDK